MRVTSELLHWTKGWKENKDIAFIRQKKSVSGATLFAEGRDGAP